MTYLEYLQLILAQLTIKHSWLCSLNRHIGKDTGQDTFQTQFQRRIDKELNGESFITVPIDRIKLRKPDELWHYRIYMMKRFIGEEILRIKTTQL